MKFRSKIIVSGVSLAMSSMLLASDAVSAAAPAPLPSAWAGSSSNVGITLSRGNSVSTNAITGLLLQYAKPSWLNKLQLTYEYDRGETETTKNKFTGNDQVNYNFSQDRTKYIFANTGVIIVPNANLSPYQYQFNFVGGYGQILYQNGDKLKWTAQLGPGYQQTKDSAPSHTVNTQLILQTETDLTWQVTTSTAVTQTLQINWGNLYNFITSNTALTDSLTQHISAQLSFNVQYYSNIPATSSNNKNTDMTTNISVLYTL